MAAEGYVDIVIGLQRGDEGKGRVVDLLVEQEGYDIVERFNGGPNAGHTIKHEGQPEIKLHQIPSGVAYPNVLNIMGNGMFVDPLRFIEERADVAAAGYAVEPVNLAISDQAHLILPHHISLDEIREAGKGGQGSTKRGIAFVAADKGLREGVRAGDIVNHPDTLLAHVTEAIRRTNPLRESVGLEPVEEPEEAAHSWLEQALELEPFVTDTVDLLHDHLKHGAKALAEGAQAFWLDLEHGMYPFVTSSNTTVGGALSGMGIGPQRVRDVIGVAKLTKSHVGGGPFVTRIQNEIVAGRVRGNVGEVDAEYGASTGRERAVGYPDLVELRNAIRVNGVSKLVLTKLDCVPRFGDVALVATAYKLGGKIRETAPTTADELERCEPVYKKLPTWQEDISRARSYHELPSQARNFVHFIGDTLGVKVTMLGVGPERGQVIAMPSSHPPIPPDLVPLQSTRS